LHIRPYQCRDCYGYNSKLKQCVRDRSHKEPDTPACEEFVPRSPYYDTGVDGYEGVI
jgi:hypothetical protein